MNIPVYKNFFWLAKDPFGVSPDPCFFFSTAKTDETYAKLLEGIRARLGMILLLGEAGTGKTLLLRRLVEQLHAEATEPAFVFDPRLSVAEFVDYVLSDLGIAHNSHDICKALREGLLARHRMGLKSVLIIDEAQDLSTEGFEVVRAFSNVESSAGKLLQIILCGQPGIEESLRQPELRAISGRIALRLRACPLSPSETSQYVAHRLQVAGGDVETVFTPEAIEAVCESAAGIPRLVNQICEHALMASYVSQRKPVDAETVLDAARKHNLGVASLSEKAVADDVRGPLEIGALTTQNAGVANLTVTPPPAAPERVSPESYPNAMPVGYAEGTDVASWEAPQPLVLGQGAADPRFAQIHILPKSAREGSGALRWASLALVSMLGLLCCYFLLGNTWLTKARPNKPPDSASRSLIWGKSTTENGAAPHAETPSDATEVTKPTQAPTEQATGVSGVKEGLLGLPRSLPGIPTGSLEVQSPRTQASRGAAAPLRLTAAGQLAVTSNVPGAAITMDGQSDPNWITPHMFDRLPPGVHSIVISKQGFKDAQQSVTVEGGHYTSLNATLAPPRGEVDISTRPPGAEVLIDGNSYGPGPVRTQLDAGPHTFMVRQAGREPVEGQLVVQDQAVVQRTIDLPLKPVAPPPMSVAITTNPPSATVYLDGAPMGGKTPISLHVSPGHHLLIIFAAGYRPVRREIDVPGDQALAVSVTLSRQ